MRALVARENPLGIGIDVGWRWGEEDVEVWWGNTKDTFTLRALILDIWTKYPSFSIDRSVIDLVEEGE